MREKTAVIFLVIPPNDQRCYLVCGQLSENEARRRLVAHLVDKHYKNSSRPIAVTQKKNAGLRASTVLTAHVSNRMFAKIDKKVRTGVKNHVDYEVYININSYKLYQSFQIAAYRRVSFQSLRSFPKRKRTACGNESREGSFSRII